MTFIGIFHRVRNAAHVGLLYAVLATAAMTGSGFASVNLTLAWDTSADPTVVGYNLYYGPATRTYTNVIQAGAATSATLSNALSGGTYYFAATTYNAAGLESDYSAELPYTAPVVGSNQAPTLNSIPNLTINENAGLQTVSLSGISSGAPSEVQTLTITASSSNPGLIPNPTVTYTSPNQTGSLSFTPVQFANGTATITVTVNDGGISNNVVSRTFTVTVNSVNQAPTLNQPADLSINENAGSQTVSLSGISSGAANEAQTLTVTASSSNLGLVPNPAVTYSSPSSTGTLTFSPAVNVTGSALITVTVNDGGASNNVISRSFTITVNGVNQLPTLNPLANLAIDENAGMQTVNLTGISSGAANELQTLTLTAASSNPGLIPNPAVSYTSPSGTGVLSFAPAAYGFGSALITVTVNDGGASNNLVSRSFTVTVNSVNQPPTLAPLANISISENAGLQTVNLMGISSGATNEAQTLTVSASCSNTNLIPNFAVNYTSPATNGTLTFTTAPDAVGTANFTVTVDDGGTTNNTITRAFTVKVSVVNNPPTLDPLNDLSINENAGLQTINLTGISSGASNEVQVLTVSAFSSNPGLIPNPTVTYSSPDPTGSLSFTPIANGSGSSMVTVMVDDGGAVSNSTIHSFLVTVNPFNAPPTLDPLTNLTVDENAGSQIVALTGIGSGATNEAQTLTITAISSNPGLVPNPPVSYTSPNPTGAITLTPLANRHGSATITVTVNDGQPINNLASRLFTVMVNQTSTPPAQVTTNWTLFWQHTNGTVGQWTMTGSNLVSTAALSPATVSPGWNIAGSSSLTGDGNEDLILQHTNGSVGAWLMNGTNCTQVLALAGVQSDPNWKLVATGDLDGDGQKDLLFEYPDGSLAVSFMNGTNCGPRLPLNPAKIDPGWRVVGAGDLDGDGQTDLLLQHKGGWIGVFLMNSTNATRFSFLKPAIVEKSWKIVGTRDFKGDGQGQILWRSAAGHSGYWQMNGTNFVHGGLFNPGWVNPAWQIVGPR